MKAYENNIRLPEGVATVGKAVPSYRMALEREINHWKSFRSSFVNEEERAAFDDMCCCLSGNGFVKPSAKLVIWSCGKAQRIRFN